MKTTQEKIDRGMALISVCKKIVMGGIKATVASAVTMIILSLRVDHLKNKQQPKNK
jgi:hypothetical protein